MDRKVLFRKLEQLNFPSRLIVFLQDYYRYDSIITEAAGISTKQQFLSRGLRQGCPMSSILFVIYLTELGPRLDRSGLGVELKDGLAISHLKFADDIFLIATSDDGLEELKSILEGWSYDFRMKVSRKKTEVISPSSEKTWFLTDLSNECELLELKQVEEYKYLGIMQKLTVKATQDSKGAAMIKKALTYKNNILRLRCMLPDKVAVYRAIWENIAIPSILYGAEVIPVDTETIKKLDEYQRQIAKSLLGVPKSTLNEVMEVEMGFKPFTQRLLEIKLKFFLSLRDKTNECLTSQTCLELLLEIPQSAYLDNLTELLKPLDVDVKMVDGSVFQSIENFYKAYLLSKIANNASFKLMPIPTVWWKKSAHVEEGKWSKTLTRFRVMNVGLGNRDTFYKDHAVFVERGRIVYCPLCIKGANDEHHLVMQCPAMEGARSTIKVGPHSTITRTLVWIQDTFHPVDSYACLRLYLGQQLNLPRSEYIYRGLALTKLVDTFFLLWSERIGKPISLRPGCDVINI